MRKNISIAPIIQKDKKDNPGQFRSLSALNKRVALGIKQQVATQVSEFTESVINNLREVIPLGFYVDGGYVGVLGNELKFQSPIDDYQFKQTQVKYRWSIFSTRTADPTNPDGSAYKDGQFNNPLSSATPGGAGELHFIEMYVSQLDGSVNCRVDYVDNAGVATSTNDGILWVEAICSRSLT